MILSERKYRWLRVLALNLELYMSKITRYLFLKKMYPEYVVFILEKDKLVTDFFQSSVVITKIG